MDVVDWLLDADPSIRWQVMRDLTHEPEAVVAAERARVTTEGWGARLLALQGETAGGRRRVVAGLDGTCNARAVAAWDWTPTAPGPPGNRPSFAPKPPAGEHAGQPYFGGEVEPCINGVAVAIGAYFGGESGSSTGCWPISRRRRLELRAGERLDRARSTPRSACSRGCSSTSEASREPARGLAARLRGQEYLLERRLLRRKSTGEVLAEGWPRFS